MPINKNILYALNLNVDEKILIQAGPLFVKSSPKGLLKDIANICIITTKRIIFIDFHLPKQTVRIKDNIPFNDIIQLNVAMRHDTNKGEPLFYIAATKAPVLSIDTKEGSYTLSLKGLLFVKRKINTLVEYIKNANPQVKVMVDYKRGDMNEAFTELLFQWADIKRKRRLILLIILLIIVLSIAIWGAFHYLKTFTVY